MAGLDDSKLLAGIPILEPAAPAPSRTDLGEAVSNALGAIGNPVRLTLLVNDPQRQTDTRSVLKLIAERIDPAGVRILVATGSHQIQQSRRERFQSELTAGIPVDEIAWHDCRADGLVSIGGLWRGHPWLAGDTPLLAIGSVEPHYFAGYTGAHKTLTIGCASYADIEANHAKSLSLKCRPGKLSGNPVYHGILDMLAALEQVCPLAAINLVQIGPRITAAFGGNVAPCLQGSVALAEHVFIRRIQRPAETLILEVTGPLAASLYQAEKGIKNNEWAVRDGGTIILQAPCPDGVGQGQFVELLSQANTYQQAMSLMASRGYTLGDHKAIKLRYLTDPACRGVKVLLVSEGISAEQAETLGMAKAPCLQEAFVGAGVKTGQEDVYFVRDAANLTVLSGSGPQQPPSSGSATIDTLTAQH